MSKSHLFGGNTSQYHAGIRVEYDTKSLLLVCSESANHNLDGIHVLCTNNEGSASVWLPSGEEVALDI